MKLAGEATTSGTLVMRLRRPSPSIVDGVLEVVRRQELRLAELAGPRADHLLGLRSPRSMMRIASMSSVSEHLRAPAIVGQCRERAQDGQLAEHGP